MGSALTAPVALTEFVHAPTAVHNFLLAGVERVAVGANLHIEIAGQRRSRRECVPAVAGYLDVAVVWVDIWFHGEAARS